MSDKEIKTPECWVTIAERFPQAQVPHIVANCNQDQLPFHAHYDGNGTWRNSHNKMVVADIAWWQEKPAPFPITSAPIANPMAIIALQQGKLMEMGERMAALIEAGKEAELKLENLTKELEIYKPIKATEEGEGES